MGGLLPVGERAGSHLDGRGSGWRADHDRAPSVGSVRMHIESPALGKISIIAPFAMTQIICSTCRDFQRSALSTTAPPRRCHCEACEAR